MRDPVFEETNVGCPLARDFVAHKYDLKHLLRTIMNSRLYQLDSEATGGNAADSKFYSHFRVKRLAAEPLLDAAAIAERVGSTKAAVSVHLSNLTKKGVILGRGYVVRPDTHSGVVVGGANMDIRAHSSSRASDLRRADSCFSSRASRCCFCSSQEE